MHQILLKLTPEEWHLIHLLAGHVGGVSRTDTVREVIYRAARTYGVSLAHQEAARLSREKHKPRKRSPLADAGSGPLTLKRDVVQVPFTERCPGLNDAYTGPPCCERAGEYNGFGGDDPKLFTCPNDCPCHD